MLPSPVLGDCLLCHPCFPPRRGRSRHGRAWDIVPHTQSRAGSKCQIRALEPRVEDEEEEDEAEEEEDDEDDDDDYRQTEQTSRHTDKQMTMMTN